MQRITSAGWLPTMVTEMADHNELKLQVLDPRLRSLTNSPQLDEGEW